MDSVVSVVDKGIISLYTSRVISSAGYSNAWLFCAAGFVIVRQAPLIPPKLQDMAENIMQAVVLQDIIQMSDAPFVAHMFNLLCLFLLMEPFNVSFVAGSAKFIFADNVSAQMASMGVTGLGFTFLAFIISQYNVKTMPRLAEVAQMTGMQMVSSLIQNFSPPGMHLVTALLLLQAISPFQHLHGEAVYQYTAYQTVQYLVVPGMSTFAQVVLFGLGYYVVENGDIKLILKMTVVQNLCIFVSDMLNNEISTDPVLVFVIVSLGIGEILTLQR